MFIDGVRQCCNKLLALNVAITQAGPVVHGDDTIPFLLTLKEEFKLSE